MKNEFEFTINMPENWLFFGVPLGTICGGNGKLVASKNLNENLDEGDFLP